MVKAVVCGAAGGIGQPLSLLLKLSPYVTELALYDVVNAPGVAVDISHISTSGKVTGYLPQDDGLSKALTGADIVLIPAGVPRKPGMTRDDLFKINAGIVQSLAEGIAKNCPDAFVLIISNPVNSTVPVAVETLKKHNAFNPHRVFGITNLDAVRARTFAAEKIGAEPQKIFIPIVGGHSGDTIVPLLSLANTPIKFSDSERDAFVHRVQYGGDEVVQAKEGKGSSTLAMAYAGFNCAEAVMRAMTGETGIVQSTFIYLDSIEGGPEIKKITGTDYFASPVELGQNGVVRIINYIKDANDYEKHLLQVAIPGLKNNIAKGTDFVTGTNKL